MQYHSKMPSSQTSITKQFLLRPLLALVIYLMLAAPCSAVGTETKPAAAALTKREFDEVIDEARRRVNRKDPPGQAWESLTRAKLVRILAMPELTDVEYSARTLLIKQGAVWDVMAFDRPSEAQEMWARWYPKQNIDKPATYSDRYLDVPALPLLADASWGKEAGAMLALMACLPGPAWHVRSEDPMRWAVEHHTNWQLPNSEDFGKCVRRHSERWETDSRSSTETGRGTAFAAILEKKISNYLLAHRCEGTGPDSCMPLLEALESLNPSHEKLVAILKLLEPEFALDTIPVMPAAQRPAREPEAGREANKALWRSVIRQLIFVKAKMPVLQRQAQSWPAGEIEKTIRTAARLTILLSESSAGTSFPPAGPMMEAYYFLNPWWDITVGGAMPASIAQLLTKLGRERAVLPGCNTELSGLPVPAWIGFALEKLEREQTSCGLGRIGVDTMYAAANNTELLEPISGLRKFLDKDGPLREEVLAALGRSCPEKATPARHDPWNVCRELAKRTADAEQKRKQDADRIAAKQLQIAKLQQTCSSDVAEQVKSFLGASSFRYQGDEPTIVASACKLWPGRESLTIATFAYDAGDEFQKQLVVAIVDARDGKVVSSYKSKIDEDATMRVDSDTLRIDTAPYDLAPGVRAFGVDITSGYMPSCGDGGWGGFRTLFVREGATLRPVLEGLLLSSWHFVEGGSARCGNNAEEAVVETATSTIAVARTISKGYADLLVTTVKTYDTGKKSKQGPAHVLLRYDGKTYPTSSR